MNVDLNADIGEGFGVYPLGNDADLLEVVSSVNVACGFHAGDPAVMRRTVEAAARAGVAIGAHPGLADLVGFGRRELEITPQDAYDLTLYQIGALSAYTRAAGVRLHHVKPHGALYNMAARRPDLAEAIVRAVRDFDPSLLLYGLAGSAFVAAAAAYGVALRREVFADRAYDSGGQLARRGTPGALLSLEAGVEQVMTMLSRGVVMTLDGTLFPVQADTICLHGDGEQALVLAHTLKASLKAAGVQIAAFPNAAPAPTQIHVHPELPEGVPR